MTENEILPVSQNPDPGNSPPESWTSELTDDETAEVYSLVEQVTGGNE